jgi:hypothetical protein
LGRGGIIMAAGITREIGSIQDMLWTAVFFQLVVSMLFYAYYPWTRQFVFTYFASPSTYGVLTSERFASLLWWIGSLNILALPPLVWVGWMNSHWLRRGFKLTFIIYCALILAWWLATVGIETWWLVTRNDPTFPDNPANSYRACCVPEFYNTVGSCPNFGVPHPECIVSINLNELGTNGDMVFFYAITWVYVIVWFVYIVLGVRLLRLTDVFVKEGDDDTSLVPLRMAGAKPDDGSTVITPTATTPTGTGAPMLLNQVSARNVVQQRLRVGGSK